MLRFNRSLSFRLLLLTVLFVMVAEVLIFLPSVARFRQDWLHGRLAAAHLAALAVVEAPDGMVTQELEQELLRQVGAFSIDVVTADKRMLMLMTGSTPKATGQADLMAMRPIGLVVDAIGTMLESQPRVLLIKGMSPKDASVRVSMLIDEGPLRDDLRQFSIRVFGLSLVISGITASLVFTALLVLTVRPLQRLVTAMMVFKTDPEGADTSALLATTRSDEVGIALRELMAMQDSVRQALRQRVRLAALGTAMAKVNHDLRGILASATLLSERLLDSNDPEVRRNGPRILASLERAALLCDQTLTYVGNGMSTLRNETVPLRALIEDVVETLRLPSKEKEQKPNADFIVSIPDGMMVIADRQQLHRVMANLVRNALESGADEIRFDVEKEQGKIYLRIKDNGPGLTPRARDNLFQPFAGSTKPHGTGLGLAIAQELVRAQGGELSLAETGSDGTVFVVSLPE